MTEEAFGDIGPQPPAGRYNAIISKIEKVESTDVPGEWYRRWTFETSKGEMRATSSSSLGPRSKGYRWARNVIGRDPKGVLPSELIGQQCLLMVEHDEVGYAKIVDVFPAHAPEAAPTVESKPEPERVEDITF